MAPSQGEASGAETRAAFEALRARFHARLPERWREIEGADTPAERVAALHRLAGAAGIYGYEEIGRAAAAAEDLAAGEAGARLEAALATLSRLIGEAAPP